MISVVKESVVNKLNEIYPTGYVIYDEALPETASKPSFVIMLTNQSYKKRINNRYISELSFDIAYYSDQEAVRADCIRVQEDLIRAFCSIDTFPVRNKIVKITDNVLHFTFDIRYFEIETEQSDLMQQQQTITNI